MRRIKKNFAVLGALSFRNADKDIILISSPRNVPYETSKRGADQGACSPNVISCVISILSPCLSFLKEFQGSAVEKQVDPLSFQMAHTWQNLPILSI